MRDMPAGSQLAEAMGARWVEPARVPLVAGPVEEISAAARIPPPGLFLLEADWPNACVWGFSPYDSAMVVNEGLLQILQPQELRAVLAHEVGHIVNGSIAEQTVMGARAAGIEDAVELAKVAVRLATMVTTSLLDDFFVIVGGAVVDRAVRAASQRRFTKWHHAHEFAADAHAAQLGLAPWLVTALFKMERAFSTATEALPSWSRVAQFSAKVSESSTHPSNFARLCALPGPFRPLIEQTWCPRCTMGFAALDAVCPGCGQAAEELCCQCNFMTRFDDRYCTSCGTRKPTHCRACGRSASDDEPYCFQCGLAVP